MEKTQEILELLRSKNRCLDRLMEATRAFLAAPLESLVIEPEAPKNPLTVYEETRTNIIRTLELHDRQISQMIEGLDASARTSEFLAEIRNEMRQNERLILGVFNADDVVFRRIGDAQAQITKLINENRKSRDILGRFKSSQTPTGEGMDRTL